jgi:dihydroxyacetone kinase-like predicted kinase
VTDLLEQAGSDEVHGEGVPFEPIPEVAKAKVGVVAVAAGDGIAELFRDFGVQGLVVGGQTMNPSVGELLEVVEAAAGRTVIVLPNNKNVVPAAEELDSLTKKSIVVVPTRSIPQGVAAIVEYEPGVDAEKSAAAMTAAASLVTTGELTRAVRDARTPVGAIREGDWLGLVDGKVRIVSSSGTASRMRRQIERLALGAERRRRRADERSRAALQDALFRLLEEVIADDTEAVTVIVGRDADSAVTEAMAGMFEKNRPGVALAILKGGQPLYPYLIGSE